MWYTPVIKTLMHKVKIINLKQILKGELQRWFWVENTDYSSRGALGFDCQHLQGSLTTTVPIWPPRKFMHVVTRHACKNHPYM